jgi:hypothetical protein
MVARDQQPNNRKQQERGDVAQQRMFARHDFRLSLPTGASRAFKHLFPLYLLSYFRIPSDSGRLDAIIGIGNPG